MRAAIFTEQDGPLVVEDVTPTDPGPRDVVVHLTASGICHSDLSVINGTLPMPPPAILGHEGTGIVEDVGAEVRHLAKGDRVIGSFIPACGTCWFCLNDQSNLCESTYSVMIEPARDPRRRDAAPDDDGSRDLRRADDLRRDVAGEGRRPTCPTSSWR